MSFTFNLCIGGQQGEGVASMGKILSQSLNEYGYYVFGYRNFSSRIKGGPTSYHLNISDERIEATKEKINLLLALDQQAIDNHTHLLADDGIIIVEELFQAKITSNHFVFTYPFEKKGAELGNKLYGNMMAIGLISKVLSLPLDYISFQVKRLFSNKSETIKNSNLVALNFGYNLPTKIPDLNLTSPNKKEKTILITGNQAVSLGLIGGGCKFMAAYPITPASEIMEYMAENIGSVGGSIIQAEDEISAISMAIGASYSGTRSITATSGPGLSLMGEAISLSGMTETPVVIVNVQRAGPSTGMPTKQEQSDLDAALYSGHGEFPRIVLSPGNPEEAFHDGVLGLNLADIYQCPVNTNQFPLIEVK
jgi:2-oxoglutarate ferredoxin oxidoreductase subunit alpha